MENDDHLTMDIDNGYVVRRKNLRILITGATGSLGKQLVKKLHLTQERVVAFSRDELKQSEMEKVFPEGGEKGLRYFIGDVRDFERLKKAFSGIEFVIHAAAMKRIESCEYNPVEALKTNVLGSLNVINAAIETGVKKVILVSTDKAPNASTLYGASKLMAERLFVSSNNLGSTRFSVVRYGNVTGSRGSVFDLWQEQKAAGKPLTVTDKRMTRFFWTLEEASQFVLRRLNDMQGGEIFLPKMTGYSVREMAEKISTNIVETGLRGIEKLHETLLTDEEARCTYDCDEYYTIMPEHHEWSKNLTAIGKPVTKDFKYTSQVNVHSDLCLHNEGIES